MPDNTKSWIFLPSTSLNEGVVKLLKRALAVGGIQVVDIGIAKGTTRNSITANTNAFPKVSAYAFLHKAKQ